MFLLGEILQSATPGEGSPLPWIGRGVAGFGDGVMLQATCLEVGRVWGLVLGERSRPVAGTVRARGRCLAQVTATGAVVWGLGFGRVGRRRCAAHGLAAGGQTRPRVSALLRTGISASTPTPQTLKPLAIRS
jgi:hypothetical protein